MSAAPQTAQHPVPMQKAPRDKRTRTADRLKRFFGWVGTVIAWLSRHALRIVLIVAIVWGAFWLWGDNAAQEQRMVTMLQQDRHFDRVTVIESARNYGRLPLVNGDGTYSVTAGICSFTVKFEGGVPVVDFEGQTVKDVDPTRLAQDAVIGPRCFPR